MHIQTYHFNMLACIYVGGEKCFSRHLIGFSVLKYHALFTSRQNNMVASFAFTEAEYILLINKADVPYNDEKSQ